MVMFNPCQPCCITPCCWFDNTSGQPAGTNYSDGSGDSIFKRLPNTLIGQSLIDGTFDPSFTLTKNPRLNLGDYTGSGPYGDLLLYSGTFPLRTNNQTCFPDARTGPVRVDVYLPASQGCRPYCVITTPGYSPGYYGIRGGVTFAYTAGAGMGLSLTPPNTVAWYLQALTFTGPAMESGPVHTFNARLVLNYGRFDNGKIVTNSNSVPVTIQYPVLNAVVPLYDLYTVSVPGGLQPPCPRYAVSLSPDRVPSEWAARSQIASPIGAATGAFDFVARITGTGSSWDGWYVGFNIVYMGGTYVLASVTVCVNCLFRQQPLVAPDPLQGSNQYATTGVIDSRTPNWPASTATSHWGNLPLYYNSAAPALGTVSQYFGLLGQDLVAFANPSSQYTLPDGRIGVISDCFQAVISIEPA